MKNGKTEHYWRIHARVTKRALADQPLSVQDAIANDPESEMGQWFQRKVTIDVQRLYEDPNYYDNMPHTFRIPRHEQIEPLVVGADVR